MEDGGKRGMRGGVAWRDDETNCFYMIPTRRGEWHVYVACMFEMTLNVTKFHNSTDEPFPLWLSTSCEATQVAMKMFLFGISS